VGSNPTPRAYLGDLYDNLKSHRKANYNETTNLAHECILDDKEQEQEKKAIISKKIDSITQSCSKPYFNKILINLYKQSVENANTICDYIIAEETELNIKNSTKEGRIKILVWLSAFHENKISFSKMTKQDILLFLNSLRRAISEDPTQRWIGSYNGRQIILNKFFRWLYNPQEPNHTQRITPECMKGIKQLPRKEKTPYSPSDLWEARDHAIFLKYCPSVRDRCFLAMANDSSCRPSELLNLRIRDIVFKKTSEGKQYAEILIKGGKTKPRTIPLIDSVPFVKDLISSHPTGSNSDSWLFISNSNTVFGSKLTLDGLTYQYKYFYKTKLFPKLLYDETVPEADKALIRNLITKKWNIYVQRHSALTQKSQYLKEHVLRDHAGWTMSSKMPQIYIHYFGNESANSILLAKGILTHRNQGDNINAIGSRECPNCGELNKTENRFCINVNCKMVLSYDSYNEEIRNEDKQKIDRLENDMKSLKEGMNKIFAVIQQNNMLSNVKPEILGKLVK
jgi:integrase